LDDLEAEIAAVWREAAARMGRLPEPARAAVAEMARAFASRAAELERPPLADAAD
jgi:hypothetical protein